jgi:glycosyltransferase involved in cell wall biosynthesis
VRLLFAVRRIAPDTSTPDAIQSARAWGSLRELAPAVLVAGWIRDRGVLPPEARAVDLCGLRAARAAWVWRSAVSTAARDWQGSNVVTTDPLTPRGGRPAVLWLPETPESNPTWRDSAWWARAGLFTRVVVATTAGGRKVAARGVAASKIVVIPPFLPAIRPSPPGVVRRLLVLGRLAPDRGAHLAIDAVARLTPAEKEGLHLTVAGPVADTSYVHHLRHLAEGQPVDLHEGYLDAAQAFASADLVLVPHLKPRAEPARVVVEARAAGIPALATTEAWGNLGEPSPALPPDATAWRDAIRTWLAHPQRNAAVTAQDPVPLWRDVLQGLAQNL